MVRRLRCVCVCGPRRVPGGAPVRRRTRTKLLMIDSQWISKLCGRNEYCAYRCIRSANGTSVASHLTE